MFNRRDQLFAICAVVLAAKLAKCDGPVKREEIAAFKRQFRIPPEAVGDIGRLVDQARDSADGYESYAIQLGEAFADNRGVLEDVLTALFAIARADGPLNGRELDFLSHTHRGFGLDQVAWDRARGAMPRQPTTTDRSDARVSRSADPRTSRHSAPDARNHPDSLASRGVPAESSLAPAIRCTSMPRGPPSARAGLLQSTLPSPNQTNASAPPSIR
jgi:DnaJ like chaperone protein